MNKTIWKFPLELSDLQRVMLPVGAEILTVQTQHDNPVLWALVNPDAPKEERVFEIFGTGHTVNCNNGIGRKYIATFQITSLQLVFHVFEFL